jgi:hypothetical protein
MCEVVTTHKSLKMGIPVLKKGVLALAENGDVQFGKRNFMQ